MQTAGAEHLAGSEAPAGAHGAQKGTQSLCREYLIQRQIEGAQRRIGGGVRSLTSSSCLTLLATHGLRVPDASSEDYVVPRR